jgi:hypothetical protein
MRLCRVRHGRLFRSNLEEGNTMERKSTAVVTAEEVKAALSKNRSVTSEEEKALRMRFGAKVDTKAPLGRAAESNEELHYEMLVMEMELRRAMKARLAAAAPKAKAAAAPRNAAKDKIVRALRKKN